MRLYIDDKDVPVLKSVLIDAYLDAGYGSDNESIIERILERVRDCEKLQKRQSKRGKWSKRREASAGNNLPALMMTG